MSDERPVDDSNGALTTVCSELSTFLHKLQRSVNDEIAAYPTPIPRCDAQFNFLYEQRSRVVGLLERVDSSKSLGGAREAILDILAEFAETSPLTDDPAERLLRARIAASLATPDPKFAAETR